MCKNDFCILSLTQTNIAFDLMKTTVGAFRLHSGAICTGLCTVVPWQYWSPSQSWAPKIPKLHRTSCTPCLKQAPFRTEPSTKANNLTIDVMEIVHCWWPSETVEELSPEESLAQQISTKWGHVDPSYGERKSESDTKPFTTIEWHPLLKIGSKVLIE